MVSFSFREDELIMDRESILRMREEDMDDEASNDSSITSDWDTRVAFLKDENRELKEQVSILTKKINQMAKAMLIQT